MQFIKHLEPYVYNYTGEPQEVTLIKGYYTLECWGANGSGAVGGYSVGDLSLQEEVSMFAYVGGNHTSTWNGGAGLSLDGGRSASGGASDLRLTLDDLYTRFIVAGGGAGGATRRSDGGTGAYIGGAGAGGGISGGTGQQASSDFASLTGGAGATQSTGYSFGAGKAGAAKTGSSSYGILDATVSGSGGGGWFGGYSGNNGTYRAPNSYSYTVATSGGGGSGYVLTSDSYKPEGYSVSEAFYLMNANTFKYGEEGYVAKDAGVTHGLIKINPKVPNANINIANGNLSIYLEMFRPYLDNIKVDVLVNDVTDKVYTYDVSDTDSSTEINIEQIFNLDLTNIGDNTVTINVYDGEDLRYSYILDYHRRPLIPNANTLGDAMISLEECNKYLRFSIHKMITILTEKGLDMTGVTDIETIIEKLREL